MRNVWGEEKFIHELWGTNLKERDHLDDLSLDGNIILKRIFKKSLWMAWTVFVWFWIGSSGGLM